MALQNDLDLSKAVTRPVVRGAARVRRLLQTSDLLFILLAAGVGLLAGVMSAALAHLSHAMQVLFYGFSPDLRLSGQLHLDWWHLLALPAGGLVLGVVRFAFPRRTRAPIDAVEANALHGGRIPARDSLIVSLQTLISNGFGASVGLEAAFAQMGGGAASKIGQWLELKRASLRTLVGAGAGGAIGAAFGAPLAGAFYAFEIILGAYTPSALAPVAAASLMAVLAATLMNNEPFVMASTLAKAIEFQGYLLYAVLGLICAGLGILIMRLVAFAETVVRKLPIGEIWRPLAGGILLMPLAFVAPQILSSGHGAMHLYLDQQPLVTTLLAVFALKVCASVISLAFGFRGGLFFASLFLGSLVGAAFAQAVNYIYPAATLDTTNAALVGMGALAVAVVGGPMTMSFMVLEVTHDFALTAAVVTAALVSSAIVRDKFGYSFSTWRLHLRGQSIRSARDVGWVKALTAQSLMRRNHTTLRDDLSVADLREQVPLGSTARVLLVDGNGDYRGILPTAEAYQDKHDPDAPLSSLTQQTEVYVRPDMDISAILRMFEHFAVDDLAVVNEDHKLLGLLTERYVNRRYAEELEKTQREFFGEQ
ncbi:voltage gated chloride channel family protein [Asticcacaulis biprosthecium C19]|uniref:Voltage gated chloride channel family protein n=1 Tax=Asticcacaulis biprosthecium C19 TaxID=715226 RepID=F4QLL7_9CAUL|nr:chloride channel protein [Asticcacaulis biprosthecium]EGF93515.1 voltage gated chloride channel family protein [Asticcacaulis biprosthecium C19]